MSSVVKTLLLSTREQRAQINEIETHKTENKCEKFIFESIRKCVVKILFFFAGRHDETASDKNRNLGRKRAKISLSTLSSNCATDSDSFHEQFTLCARESRVLNFKNREKRARTDDVHQVANEVCTLLRSPLSVSGRISTKQR